MATGTRTAARIAEDSLPRPRRARRTREDVEGRIRAAARQLFSELGYAATTTREIAQVADVSETLLFRYFGDKAQLFDAVVSAPFNQLIKEFTAAQHAFGSPEAPNLYRLVYDLLTENRDLLKALVFGGPPAEALASGARPSFEPFFEAAVNQLEAEYRALGKVTDFNYVTGIRLAFGMMASAVLMREWLFLPGGDDRDHLIAVLETMVSRALGTTPTPQ
jgi:AcrR family transcriptional regulator